MHLFKVSLYLTTLHGKAVLHLDKPNHLNELPSVITTQKQLAHQQGVSHTVLGNWGLSAYSIGKLGLGGEGSSICTRRFKTWLSSTLQPHTWFPHLSISGGYDIKWASLLPGLRLFHCNTYIVPLIVLPLLRPSFPTISSNNFSTFILFFFKVYFY